MDKEELRNKIKKLGVDLCGFGSVERMNSAPEGFRPRDVLPESKTVISFAIASPFGALKSTSPHPYTRIRNSISDKLNSISLDVCLLLEKEGYLAIPIPIENVFDEKTGRFRSIISIKHAAQAAGIGTIGRNSLLITPEYGSLVWLGAVLTDADIESDPLLDELCRSCDLCVKACPVNALEKEELDQKKCSSYCSGEVGGKWAIICHACRDVCPKLLGEDRSWRE
ncbi:MAG: epoxyqueuosine reductase [Ruminococcaceae bacterium]|jgi:epoxyqueuosine reductase|nr:epoxyqueuosine reductase [Oscillospiraceae bacterium]